MKIKRNTYLAFPLKRYPQVKTILCTPRLTSLNSHNKHATPKDKMFLARCNISTRKVTWNTDVRRVNFRLTSNNPLWQGIVNTYRGL